MTEDDIRYFERRRRECVERANSSDDPSIVAIYRSFAVQYMRLLQDSRVANEPEFAEKAPALG